MGLRINQNVMAMNAYRNLTTSEGQLSKSLERLSSGYRINRAADDAAGLVISEGLRSQVMGLKMATRNAQDGVSVVQTAEGALTETHSILQRMRELAVQAASTGSSDQPSRDAAQVEVAQLTSELDRIAATTQFGQQILLNGNYGVTPGVVTGTAAAGPLTISTGGGGNDLFNINLNGQGAVAVQLTAATYAVNATGAANLQTDITNKVVSALAGAGKTYTGVSVKVGFDSATAPTALTVTFSATDAGGSIDLTSGANDFLSAAGITPAGPVLASGSSGTFQVGSGVSVNDQIKISIGNMASGATGLGLQAVDVSNSTLSSANLNSIDAAITAVSTLRGNLGAYQNRFEHTIANLSITTENLTASESRIRDTDMASEMMSFTRAQILQQAGTAMLAQANSVPQSVLQLLK